MNIRPRRNRKSGAIREMVAETSFSANNLVMPLFLVDGKGIKKEVLSLPGTFRFSMDTALQEMEQCLKLGIRSFILFPAIEDHLKDTKATYSYNSKNFYLKFIQEAKKKFPEACLISDVAMDPYSSDGHDGLVEGDRILNDETLPILAKMALAQAEAGIDMIGPSDMMDGRVRYLREHLDNKGFYETSIMAYTAKYASAFYGPFRDALDSAPKKGNKKTYQMDFRNAREAMLEASLDVQEGADFIMVKPALHYLDIIHQLHKKFNLPVAAYHVSGECAMLLAASKNGWLDYPTCLAETFYSIKRAGANVIISYLAKDYASIFTK